MYIKKNSLIETITMSVIVLFAFISSGQAVPNYLNYQGKLMDQSTGQPIPDGNHNVTFRICDNATIGGVLWNGTYSVPTKNGLFNTLLGPIDASVFDGSDRWMEVEVDGEIIGTRQQIVSVAYAIRATSAADADTLEGHPASDFGDGHSLDAADGSPTDAVFVDNDGNVRIGITEMGTKLHIAGGTKIEATDFVGLSLPLHISDQENPSGFGRQIRLSRLGESFWYYDIGLDEENEFFIMKRNSLDKALKIDSHGRVGIGTTNPAYRLDVASWIRSSSGGFVFPDGTTQTTAATGGDADWTILGSDMYSAVSGNVGIGTTSPAAKLHLQDGSVLFSGTTGATPASGAGTRMMWIPEKKAFRAGEVTENQWDADNIGNWSFAVGYDTKASGEHSTAMGRYTTASGRFSTAMGRITKASGEYSTAMGRYSTASGWASTAMSLATASGSVAFAVGNSAEASGDSSIAMGHQSRASGTFSTAIGTSAKATGENSIAIGYGTEASGEYSLAMGEGTTASGDNTTAMGYHASTNGKKGSFVYGDHSTNTTMTATADNQFMVRASGGTIFYSNSSLTAGVSLAPGGGSWSSVSDRNRKENFKEEYGEEVLKTIAGMPISSWNYKSQHPSIRHLGPTAHDFYAAFHLGESDTTITTTDIDGINMLAIQALEKRTTELKEKIEELEKVRAELAEVKAENAEMKGKMAQFEAALQKLEALTATLDNGSRTGKINN